MSSAENTNSVSDTSPSPNERSFVMRRMIGGILWLLVGVSLLVMWFTPNRPTVIQLDGSPTVEPLPEVELEQREVASFSLTERSGETVTKQDLLGQEWVVNFIFTRCVMSCPGNTKAMMELAENCEDTDVKLVTITVDPEHDTPERLQDYSEIYGADPEQWLFLTGEKDEIHDLIRNSFLQAVEERTGKDRLLGYEFAHTDRVMHINEDGLIVGQYLATDPVSMATLSRVLHDEMDTPEKNEFLVPKAASGDLPAEAGTSTPAVSEESAETVAQEEIAEPAVPGWLKSLPAVNASLNGLATVLLVIGFILIKQRKVQAHKATMLTAFGVSAVFLVSYLTYHFGLQAYTGESSKSFPDLGFIRQVYLVILISHILLAVTVPVLAGMSIYLGLRGRIERHRTIARITFPIWLYVSVTGVIIYYMLYHLAGVA